MAGARNRSLDVLRTFAVLSVLVFHFTPWPLAAHGWMGVDLFFVLSGFLVSGLLFDELRRTGSAKPGRFLVRRAFKIYPVFWIMIAVSVASLGVTSWRALACELLFFQNYGPGIWVHTWSLAVEEHFYVLVALAFAWRGVFSRLETPASKVGAFGFALLAVLIARVVTVVITPPRFKLIAFGTHVRIDTLLCGVAIAWLIREPTLGPRARAFVRRWRALLVAVALLLISPVCFLGHEHVFTKTIGYSLIYVAFGVVLLVALSFELDGPGSRAIAWVGRSSYSIYLWHLPLHELVLVPLAAKGMIWLGWPSVAVLGSVGAGLVSTRLLEEPVLKLRDRWVRPRTPEVMSP